MKHNAIDDNISYVFHNYIMRLPSDNHDTFCKYVLNIVKTNK